MKQLNLFLQDGIIRCTGRIENSDLDWNTRNPILMPYKCHLTDLMILDDLHRIGHLGVASVVASLRQTVWIPKAKQRTKTIIGQCLCVRKFKAELTIRL